MDLIKRVFVSELKGIDEKENTLTAYVSTNTVDRMDEALDPAGMDASNYKKNPVVLWAHDYSLPPIGKALWVKRDGVGILSKVKFASTAFAQEIFQLYKEGFLKAFSVGFIPKEVQEHDEDEDDDKKCNSGKKPQRTFKKWELLEYSAVPVPANPDALALAMQKGILKTEALIKALQPEVKEEVIFDTTTETTKETTTEEKKEINPIVINPALEELIAENTLLKQQIEAFKNQITELNYKVYEYLSKKTENKQPGITANELNNKVVEEVSRVIRRLQGKVE